MPTYVYGCDTCGQQFEKSQKFSDEPVRDCPTCGSRVRRIIQPAGIVFKGSGWHITDYKRAGNGAATSDSNGESNGEKDASTETKSEPSTAKSEPSDAKTKTSTSSETA